MSHAAEVVATLGTQQSTYTGAQTVVAIPPSTLDAAGLIRVDVAGTIITRAYDPTMPQP